MGYLNTYKRIAALTILITLLLQTFNWGLIITDYYLNTETYAANCVNKDKVEMHCNGKCQMMKEMQQQEKKDQQKPAQKTEIVLTFFYSEEPCQFLFPISASDKNYGIKPVSKPVDRPHTIFHPPTA